MLEFDVIADWALNKSCNFSCPYCFVSAREKRRAANRGHDVQEIVDAFNNSGKTWLVHMSGGEPFLHTDFICLCKGLTEKHSISVNSNLSSSLVYDFCEHIDPQRVSFVHCSLHIVERERKNLVNDFIEKVKVLEQAKFNVFITQVMWPPVVETFRQVSDFFSKHGMCVRPKLFRGYYKGKEYPGSYSQIEKNTILDFMQMARENTRPDATERHINPDLDRMWIDGHVSFRGAPCLAGSRFVSIDLNGDIRRCGSDRTRLGNIYRGEFDLLKEAHPCRARICGCPYHGVLFSSGTHRIVKNRIPVLLRQMLDKI